MADVFLSRVCASCCCCSDDIASTGFRLRLYGFERLRRERLIAECVVWLSSLGLQRLQSASDAGETGTGKHQRPVQEFERWVALQPRSNFSVRTYRAHPVRYRLQARRGGPAVARWIRNRTVLGSNPVVDT